MRTRADTAYLRKTCLAVAVLITTVVALAAQPALSPSLRALFAGDPVRAEALAEAAIEADPQDPSGFVDLAQTKMATGRFEAAYRDLRRALALEPDHPDALLQMAKVGLVLSEREYSILFAKAPDFYRAHQLSAESAGGRGDYEEARKHYVRALEAQPESVTILTALGDLVRTKHDLVQIEEREKFDAALGYYDTALELEPDNHDAHYGSAVCWYRRGDNPRALQHFESAAEIDPDSAIAHLGVGVIRAALEEHEKAIDAFERAIASEPGMEQAYVLLSRSYRATGRPQEARRILEELQRRHYAAAEEDGLLDGGGPR